MHPLALSRDGPLRQAPCRNQGMGRRCVWRSRGSTASKASSPSCASKAGARVIGPDVLELIQVPAGIRLLLEREPDCRPPPRWSQAKERRIGELFRRPDSLMFNGYEKEVAALYKGMDLRMDF